MPRTWYEGPFLGNARLGSGIYAEPGDANPVRFNVQHSEVQDHRPEFGSLFGPARLPIGYGSRRRPPIGGGPYYASSTRKPVLKDDDGGPLTVKDEYMDDDRSAQGAAT